MGHTAQPFFLQTNNQTASKGSRVVNPPSGKYTLSSLYPKTSHIAQVRTRVVRCLCYVALCMCEGRRSKSLEVRSRCARGSWGGGEATPAECAAFLGYPGTPNDPTRQIRKLRARHRRCDGHHGTAIYSTIYIPEYKYMYRLGEME